MFSLYHFYIVPIMGFGDSVYDSCFQGQLNAPDLLQAFEESADRALL